MTKIHYNEALAEINTVQNAVCRCDQNIEWRIGNFQTLFLTSLFQVSNFSLFPPMLSPREDDSYKPHQVFVKINYNVWKCFEDKKC